MVDRYRNVAQFIDTCDADEMRKAGILVYRRVIQEVYDRHPSEDPPPALDAIQETEAAVVTRVLDAATECL